MIGKLQFDFAPGAVALRVGRLIADQVLVRQLFEDLGKGSIELIAALDEQRPAAAEIDELLDAALELSAAARRGRAPP